ncbi:hypothetical protein KUTeg_001854 [Tegillarca granosa]|uniref:Uncharacterized protein n=1 Tax=Tegillarca granosa TaxID=220873 RepID=A0ABQ9FU48_TEGGR|nr:hypothetical protein KUTeg_001854 [Tegillarca granosa]
MGSATMNRPKSVCANPASIVAAIDFGTTYSSCAYSFKDEDTLKINMNEKWSGGVDASSVPTSVLLDKDFKFVAFGHHAEKQYEGKTYHKEHLDWHLFRRFKMTLHNNENLGLNTEIEDENGVKERAVTIFSMAIKDIKKQLMESLKRSGHDVDDSHILWVLTVPAIWTEAAKQFMQEGCRYGGTVDVTIQEVLKPNANLKILDKASGGDWGGVSVDKYFLNFIKKLVGFDVYEKFSRNFPYQKLKFEKAMEACKREATPDTSKALYITIPQELIRVYGDFTSRKFDSSIVNQTQFSKDILINGNEMEIKQNRIHDFYDKTINNIISHVENILKNKSAEGVSYLLLVGGFAESPLVEARIKKAFEGDRIKRVIVPREAGHAVVKGAVIFGHNPNAIAERVSPYTYGVETRRNFDPHKHAGKRKIKVNGVDKVAHVFDKHITINEIMYVGKPNPEHIFYTINPKLDKSSWNVYYTEKPDPTFCDDAGCSKLGTVEIELEGKHKTSEKRELGFRMTCQGTVLEAEACDKSTGKRLASIRKKRQS